MTMTMTMRGNDTGNGNTAVAMGEHCNDLKFQCAVVGNPSMNAVLHAGNGQHQST